MSIRDDLILWLDLETTGSDSDASILEVGVYLTDPSATEALAELSMVVWPDRLDNFLTMDPVVVDMHLKNGLAVSVMSNSVKSSYDAEKELLAFLDAAGVAKSDRVPLAGSGVSHFDRQFIRREWPQFDKRLTYWAYDVGVIRRSMRLAGLPIAQNAIAHRALADAKAHAAEFADYLRLFKQITR